MKLPRTAKLAIASALAALSVAAVFITWISSSPLREESKLFTIPRGATVTTAAVMLQQEGIIRNARFFTLVSRITGKTAIRAGRYRAYRNDSSFRILDKIMTGMVLTAKVTIPEGYSIPQIAQEMEAMNICPAADLVKYSRDPALLKRLGINAPSAEGYLFPDTYVIAEGLDAREVIGVMAKKTFQVLDQLGWKSGRNGMNTHQLLTLASIIEREARLKEEQKKISSVFHNRLKINMKLQSCATVLYALGRIKPKLYLKDLEVDSPWNTYLNAGLPPTPIASPGKGAIDAAINPDTTDYLFFVSRRDGSHHFAKKFSDHLKAQDYYLHGEENGFNETQK